MASLQQQIYTVAKSFNGLREIKGHLDNGFLVSIIVWALPFVRGQNDIDGRYAYCGIFLGHICKSIGKEHLLPNKFYRARNWLNVGININLEEAQKGDFVIFYRGHKDGRMGHVSLYESHDKEFIRCFGANQSNAIRSSNYRKDRLLGVRRMVDVKSYFLPDSKSSVLSKLLKKYI